MQFLAQFVSQGVDQEQHGDLVIAHQRFDDVVEQRALLSVRGGQESFATTQTTELCGPCIGPGSPASPHLIERRTQRLEPGDL